VRTSAVCSAADGEAVSSRSELLFSRNASTGAKRVFTGSAPSVPFRSTTGFSVSA
jgi:hypothetical protein